MVTSVQRNGFDIITVVLGADTKKIRTIDSIELIEYIYSNYEMINLENLVEKEFDNWSKINEKRIVIYKGKKESANIKLEDYRYKLYPVKKDYIKDIKIIIENVKTYFEAPVYKQTQIANVRVKIGDIEIMNIPIIINESIERKEIKDYILECLKGFRSINYLG